jgi:hypothetical protein
MSSGRRFTGEPAVVVSRSVPVAAIGAGVKARPSRRPCSSVAFTPARPAHPVAACGDGRAVWRMRRAPLHDHGGSAGCARSRRHTGQLHRPRHDRHLDLLSPAMTFRPDTWSRQTTRIRTVRAEPSSCGTQPAYISLTPPSLSNDRQRPSQRRSKRKPPRLPTGRLFTCLLTNRAYISGVLRRARPPTSPARRR